MMNPATDTAAAAATSNSVAVLDQDICRLCLKRNENLTDIFPAQSQEQTPTDAVDSLAQRLYDFLQIKYEPSTTLPSRICPICLRLVEAFTRFRQTVQTGETHLQIRNTQMKSVWGPFVGPNDYRPGLNGNPGTFVPEPDAIIEDVDPDQNFNSSDDEFSMESDEEEDEDVAQASQHATGDAKQQAAASAPVTVINELTGNELTPAAGQTVVQPEEIPFIDHTVGVTHASANSIAAIATHSCQYCDIAFTTQEECAAHESSHNLAMPYTCNYCDLRFDNRPGLISHIRERHNASRPFLCPICSKGFCRRADLKKHAIVHTGVRPFICAVCNKGFSRNTNLTKHMRIHNSDKPHACKQCARSFATQAELRTHESTHSVSKMFRCSRCPANFARKDKCTAHEQMHTRRDAELQMQQQQLNPVGNAISNSGDISDQMRLQPIYTTIDEPTPNSNPTYGLAGVPIQLAGPTTSSAAAAAEELYRNSQILAAAQAMHQQQQQQQQLQQQTAAAVRSSTAPAARSSRGNFHCAHCTKSFTRNRDLQRHQALHLDLLFTCSQCGMGFNRAEKLARHEQQTHGQQYPCVVCGAKFQHPRDLELHLQVHVLQNKVAMNTQAAINAAAGQGMIMGAAGGGGGSMTGLGVVGQDMAVSAPQILPPGRVTLPPPPPLMTGQMQLPPRNFAADMSFLRQMVPTMNLGFYSESRPDNHN